MLAEIITPSGNAAIETMTRAAIWPLMPRRSSDGASASGDNSSSTGSNDDILKQFLQSLQESLSAWSSTSYGATGSSSPSTSSASFSALLLDYQS